MPEDPVHSQSPNADQLDIMNIVKTIWAGRRTVATVWFVFVVLAIIYLHVAKYTYTATLTVIPTQNQSQSITGRLGDLASIAGVDLNKGQTSPPFVIYPNLISSRAVAVELARDPYIMRTLFRGQWNSETGRWEQPKTFMHFIAILVKPIIGMPSYAWQPPGPAQLQDFVSQNVKIVDDPKKSIITLIYNDTDPVFAAYFLQHLHESTDKVLRRITLDRASKYANYIEDKLRTVQLAELRQVLTNSLSDQETLIMMGNSDTPFAAQPIGPAVSSPRPTQPKPPLILILNTLLGAALGAIVVFMKIPMIEFAKQLIPSRIGNLGRSLRRITTH